MIMGKKLKLWLSASSLFALHPHYVSRRILYSTRRCVSGGLATMGYYEYPHRIIFLAGMAMSASTWMKNMLARIPGYFTRPAPMPREVAINQNICDSAFKYVPKRGYTLYKTHLNPTSENLECIFQNEVEKVLITYRDLRDVAIARYHRLMEFPKEPGDPYYVDYSALGAEKALDHNIEHVASVNVPWIRGWFDIAKENPERYHFTKFEDLKRDTKGEFRKVLKFYGIDLPDKKIEEIVEAAKGRGNMKKNMTAAKILPWGYTSNFRSGKIGNWTNELTDAQIEKCKKLLGPALIELGYERDLIW